MIKKEEHRKRRIASAIGEYKADLVIKNTRILNVFTGEFEEGDVAVKNGYFVGIGDYEGEQEVDGTGKTLVPGFIDGHLHLESSIVTPMQYGRAVMPHGTTSIVCDPHEIANVCGSDGIDYVLHATEDIPLDVYVMIPSCVPATPFDETGYTINSATVKEYLNKDRVLGLAEMMNYPGVVSRDAETIEKIKAAHETRKIVDGHGPGLSGRELNAYVTAGIFSDHECVSAKEAKEKLRRGQWIMIREGTAGRNLEALMELCNEPFYHRCLFVTDDKHPGELNREGHIDSIIRKAISLGAKPENAYIMASLNAASYFHLASLGAICPGYRADFVILNDFVSVDIQQVYKDGSLVFDKDHTEALTWGKEYQPKAAILNTVNISDVTAEDFVTEGPKKVIGLVEGEILTTDEGEADHVDVTKDILKLAVVERHHHTGHIGLCYVKGYGLKHGAVATSIAHDSHNLICVGENEADMAYAIMELKKMKGGMVVVEDGKVLAELALPIAGLMCDLDVEEAQNKMDQVKAAAYKLGVNPGIDPFMTMSFSSLPVIPTLRLTTLGVVDVTKFKLLALNEKVTARPY